MKPLSECGAWVIAFRKVYRPLAGSYSCSRLGHGIITTVEEIDILNCVCVYRWIISALQLSPNRLIPIRFRTALWTADIPLIFICIVRWQSPNSLLPPVSWPNSVPHTMCVRVSSGVQICLGFARNAKANCAKWVPERQKEGEDIEYDRWGKQKCSVHVRSPDLISLCHYFWTLLRWPRTEWNIILLSDNNGHISRILFIE